MIEYKILKPEGFTNIAQKAKTQSIKGNETVFFEIKGVRVEVNKETNIEWLMRDFFNALNMEWPKIGPDCVERYDDETQKLIDDKNQELK